MTRDDNKGNQSSHKRKDLRLIKPEQRVEPRELDAATDALRAAIAPQELDALDNEALLALALGDDVAEMDVDEQDAAETLRLAMQGEGTHPLAELAEALRAAHAAAPIAAEDNEALIALGLGTEVKPSEDTEVFTRALGGRGRHGLADLALSLQAAQGRDIDDADHEVLLALSVGEAVAMLPRSDAGSQASVMRMLRATAGHPRLDAEDNTLLIAMTTGVEDGLDHSGAELTADLSATANALRAAAGRLPDLSELANERLIRNALEAAVGQAKNELVAREAAPVTRLDRRQRSGALVGAIVALAAGFALFFGSLKWLETRAGGPVARTNVTAVSGELVTTRSTTELFDPMEKFPAKGGESARMQKIVSSRASDLRNNRFAAWGVK